MSRTVAVVFMAAFTLFFPGCSSRSSVRKGDRLIVLEDLRERAETQWEDAYTDGFVAVIPKGTVLEVLYTPTAGANVIECVAVEVNGVKDIQQVAAFFVPEHIRTKKGYKSYAFAINKSLLGTKVQKSE